MKSRLKTSFIMLAALALMVPIFSQATKPVAAKGKTSIVGKINNKPITLSEFNQMLENFYSNAKQQNNVKTLNGEQKTQANDDLWNELIKREIFDMEIKNKKIAITPVELDEYVKKNPPAQVKQIEVLKTNGKFDIAKYNQAIQADKKFKDQISEMYRQQLLYDKLLSSVKAKAKVYADSVKKEYYKNNDLADAKIIFFDFQKVKNLPAVEDSAIRNYYQANIETYKKDPARKYRYVKIPLIPSKEDSLGSAAMAKVDSVYQAVKAGADFAETAKKYSQDPTARKGGDMDYFTKAKMGEEFFNKASNLDIGEVGTPFRAKQGWHIIKVTDKRKNEKNFGEEEIRASHILIKVLPSEATKTKLQQTANLLHSKAKDIGLEKAAAELKYTTQITDELFENSKFVPGIGRFENLVKFAFANKVGTLAEMVTNPAGDYFVPEISDSLGIHYDPFEKKSTGIKTNLETRKKQEEIVKIANKFVQDNTPEKYLEAAQKDNWEIIEAKDIKSEGNITKVGSNKDFNKAILSKEVNQWTNPTEVNKNYYLAQVTKRVKPTQKDWEKAKAGEMKKARENEQNKVLMEWYNKAKEKVKVEDKREDFFKMERKKMTFDPSMMQMMSK